jgi:hypothetical protein
MQISVDINKLPSGRVQIAVFRPTSSNGFSLTYPNPQAARDVLLALGLPPRQIEDHLSLLAEIGPIEVLHFAAQEISDEVLAAQGFRI